MIHEGHLVDLKGSSEIDARLTAHEWLHERQVKRERRRSLWKRLRGAWVGARFGWRLFEG